MTAPNAEPKNIATTDSTLLANLGLLPFAIEESAAMPVIVRVRTVVVRSGIASFRTAAFRVPIASAVRASSTLVIDHCWPSLSKHAICMGGLLRIADFLQQVPTLYGLVVRIHLAFQERVRQSRRCSRICNQPIAPSN
jgi:hypothetical protein